MQSGYAGAVKKMVTWTFISREMVDTQSRGVAGRLRSSNDIKDSLKKTLGTVGSPGPRVRCVFVCLLSANPRPIHNAYRRVTVHRMKARKLDKPADSISTEVTVCHSMSNP